MNSAKTMLASSKAVIDLTNEAHDVAQSLVQTYNLRRMSAKNRFDVLNEKPLRTARFCSIE